MKHFFLALAVLATAFVALPLRAAEFSDTQKKEIGETIREYLLENPGVIMEALNAYQAQEEQAEQQRFKTTFEAKKKDLLENDGMPTGGNPDADVTIVEFFDYNCGYCKRATEDVVALLEKDKNVRFIFVDIPILGPSSQNLAHWAMASHKQDKYFEFHTALMQHKGGKNDKTLEKIAKDVGLDVKKLKKDKDSDSVKRAVENNLRLSREFGISGTPAFIVGDQLIPGYVGLSGLQDAVARARK